MGASATAPGLPWQCASTRSFSEGRSREMDGAAAARALHNQHIVTARAGPKMAAEGNGWAG